MGGSMSVPFGERHLRLVDPSETDPETAHGYFGLCPQCGRHDGYLNIGSEHWFHCDTHKVKWCAGSNLFSDWLEETNEEHARHWAKLAGYREILPAFDRESRP